MRTLITADANCGGASACGKRVFPRENRFFSKNRGFLRKKSKNRGLSREKTPFFSRKNALFLENRFRTRNTIFATFRDRETSVRTLINTDAN